MVEGGGGMKVTAWGHGRDQRWRKRAKHWNKAMEGFAGQMWHWQNIIRELQRSRTGNKSLWSGLDWPRVDVVDTQLQIPAITELHACKSQPSQSSVPSRPV